MNKSLYMALLLISASFGLNASDCEAERAHYARYRQYAKTSCDNYQIVESLHRSVRSDGIEIRESSNILLKKCILDTEEKKRAKAAYQQCQSKK